VDLTSFEFDDPLHGADAEIATVRDLPFVVLFGEQRPDKPQQRGAVGEDADDLCSSFLISL
jgi:hypothetical protein